MTATFDVLVVGSDEASLCAAACAARGGARVGLLRQKQTGKNPSIASIAAVPNAVWRRLDLQDFGISLDPVSAQATLLPDEKTVVTYDSARKTGDVLAAEGVDDHLLWSAFLDDMKQLKRTARLDDMMTTSVNGAAPLVSLLEDTQRLSAIAQVTGSCTAQLDDYFSDPSLKAHLAAHAMGRVGLGGKELGAALERAEAVDETAWRVRAHGGNKPLFSALEKVCGESGVEFFEGTNSLGTNNTSPYTLTWTNVPAGSYDLAAIAYDSLLSAELSALSPVLISVASATSLGGLSP